MRMRSAASAGRRDGKRATIEAGLNIATEVGGRHRESRQCHEISAVEVLASDAERVAKDFDLGNAVESQRSVVEKDSEKLHLTEGGGYFLATGDAGPEGREGLLVRGPGGPSHQQRAHRSPFESLEARCVGESDGVQDLGMGV